MNCQYHFENKASQNNQKELRMVILAITVKNPRKRVHKDHRKPIRRPNRHTKQASVQTQTITDTKGAMKLKKGRFKVFKTYS